MGVYKQKLYFLADLQLFTSLNVKLRETENGKVVQWCKNQGGDKAGQVNE
jgi:hypothetical protein